MLDPQACYAAVRSRDPRFDGRFFTGVRTTGVYCRPVCPARTPRFENVAFYRSASAAEAAGFRPCRRCHPEAAPPAAAWDGAPAAVRRALRLIEEGALDDGDVPGLAARVGVGPRHLRRLFGEHLGAAPLAVASTRRAHFARTLVDGTDLTISEIALAAGYGSIRRFNDAYRAAFGEAPSAARRPRRAGEGGARGLELRLAYRPPLDWGPLRAFFAAHALPGVEAVDDRGVRFAVRSGARAGVLRLRPHPTRAELRVEVPLVLARELLGVRHRVARMVDLHSAPDVVLEGLRPDPLLALALGGRRDLRVPGRWDPFECAVRAVLGQGVSVAAANTLGARLVARAGEPLATPEDGVGTTFPTPERLAEADLSGLGATAARTSALRTLAAAVASGELRFEALEGLDDAVERLCALPGIGPWTAHYVALRALGEPDAFPVGDLVLRRVASELAGVELSRAELERRAERWRPWRAYAATALWDVARARTAPRRAA